MHAQTSRDETATANGPVRLSLDSCHALALRNQAELKNSQLAVEAAKETKKAAFTKYFPSVSATAAAFKMAEPLLDLDTKKDEAEVNLDVQYKDQPASAILEDLKTYLSSNPILAGLVSSIDLAPFFQSAAQDISINGNLKAIDQGATAMVTAIQPVFAGGRIVNGNRLAKVGVEAAEYQQQITQQDNLIKVDQNYWLITALKEKQKTVSALETLLDTLAKDVSAAYEAGVVTKTDLLKVKLKQNEIRSNQNTLDNGIRLATMALCQLIGIPYREDIQLTDSLRMETEGLKTDFAISESLSLRNESKLLDLNVQAEKLKAKMILGEAMPQIGIGATAFYYNLTNRDMGNACIFATASIPLTAWWEQAHQYKKQQIQVQIAENKRQNLNEMMQLQIQQAANEVENLRNELLLKEEAEEEAAENMNESKNYYDAGLVSLSDYLEAQGVWQNASSAVTESKVALRTAYQKYLQVSGRDIRGIQ